MHFGLPKIAPYFFLPVLIFSAKSVVHCLGTPQNYSGLAYRGDSIISRVVHSRGTSGCTFARCSSVHSFYASYSNFISTVQSECHVGDVLFSACEVLLKLSAKGQVLPLQ